MKEYVNQISRPGKSLETVFGIFNYFQEIIFPMKQEQKMIRREETKVKEHQHKLLAAP